METQIEYYSSKHNLEFEETAELQNCLSTEIHDYFANEQQGGMTCQLVYALTQAGWYPPSMIEELCGGIVSNRQWSGWSLRIIDRTRLEIPAQPESKVLYLVILRDHESISGKSSWVDRVRFVEQIVRTENDCRCVLLWDGFPNPSYPQGLQIRTLVNRDLEDRRMIFQHGDWSCNFRLSPRIYLLLSGYLPRPSEMTDDTSNLGQTVRALGVRTVSMK